MTVQQMQQSSACTALYTPSADRLDTGHGLVPVICFHLPTEPNGFLSNWYPAEFDLDGHHFTSTEQYIMYRKAELMNDPATAQKTLQTDDPQKQQDLGQSVTPFIPKLWDGTCQLIALRALTAKFTQNPALRQALLATGDAWLVECAHKDKIWACGCRLTEPERLNIQQWPGKNILGFALMEVRRGIREE